jgi:hypothetical protein
MVCLSYCVLGAGLLFGSIVCMATSKNAGYHADFQNLLSPEQMNKYKEVVNERLSIYIQGLLIGVILGLIVVSMLERISSLNRVCVFVVVALVFNVVYYLLMPKTTYMLQHLNSNDQVNAWLQVYKVMRQRYILGFFVGIIGYAVFAYSLCD